MKPSGDVAAVALFDRLVDSDRWMPREAKPFRTLDLDALRESVATEIQRIFTTRCHLTLEQAATIDPSERTVIDYGVPDFSSLSPNSETDAQLLLRVLQRALISYEPRLHSPQVRLVPMTETDRRLVVQISGTLGTSKMQEPFSFPLTLQQASRDMPGDANAA